MEQTQQEYLRKAYNAIRETLIPAAPAVDEVVLSYGFPSRGARTTSRRVLGECHYDKAASGSVDGYKAAIFIHPCQWTKPLEVLHVLVHEICHAATPGSKHRGAFVKLANAVGLEGKPTATFPGDILTKRLNEIADTLGEFPRAPINLKAKKKKGSRLRLYECQCDEPVKVRVARDDFRATCDLCFQPFKMQE